jgi:hypothetical protein
VALIEASAAVASNELVSWVWRNTIVDENRQSGKDCRAAQRL